MKAKMRDWQILWFYFRSYKLYSFVVLLFMLVSGFLEMLNLAALYPIINYGLSLEKKNAVLRHFERISQSFVPDNPFLAACIILIIISILSILTKILYNYFSNKLQARIVGDTQKSIFKKFMEADYSYYVKNQQGHLIYSGTMAPQRTGTAILTTLSLVYSSITALFLFSLLVVLSWQATCVIILVGFLYTAVIQNVMKRYITRCAQISVEENQNKNIILNELITGIKPIKVFLAFDWWKKKYVRAVDRQVSSQFQMMMGKVFPFYVYQGNPANPTN